MKKKACVVEFVLACSPAGFLFAIAMPLNVFAPHRLQSFARFEVFCAFAKYFIKTIDLENPQNKIICKLYKNLI